MDKTRIEGQKLDLHPHRVAAWLDARDAWETAQHIFPIYVEISPVGSCIHECTFCSVEYMLDREDHPRIAYPVMARTLSDMAENGVLSVMFAGCGEPLAYRDPSLGKDLADVILHADRTGLDTSITTNAVLLKPSLAERALSAERLRWIRTSINGGTADVYGRIHRCDPRHFDQVLRNLEEAVKIRDRTHARTQFFAQLVALPESALGSRRSLVKEHYPSNVPTIVPLAQRLRNIGIDNFAVKPFKLHTVERDVSRSTGYEDARFNLLELEDALREIELLETPSFEVTVRRESMQHAVADDRGYACCPSTPFHWAYVEADGEVWGCSAYVGRIEANGRELGDHRFRFGNVNDQSFPDIWRGERRRACWEYTRKPPSEGGLDVRNCMKGCQMDMPNRYLWEVLHPGPTHRFIK